MDLYQTSIRNFGPSKPHGSLYMLIDCGKFAIWSYRRPTLHTRDARRDNGPSVVEWAYCLRSEDGLTWLTSQAVPGFASEEAARTAGEKATKLS